MADLACLHQFVEHRERLGDRRLVRVAARRRRADPRRVRAPWHDPLREMDLVEVDIVGLQPLQRFVDRVENVGAHQLRRPVAAKPGARRAPHHLGGEDDLVAVLARLHPVADIGLGAPLRLRLGRDRIELGRVEEIDAAIEGEIHLGVAVGLGVLLAPGHGAEADRGNMDVGAAEAALLHGALRKGLAWAWGGTPGGKPTINHQSFCAKRLDARLRGTLRRAGD